MENWTVLTNFPEDVFKNYYIPVENTGLPEDYTLFTGGNYVFLSNNRGRTIRFSADLLKGAPITSVVAAQFLAKIREQFPNF